MRRLAVALTVMMVAVMSAVTFTACDDAGDDYYESPSSPLCGAWYSPDTATYFYFAGSGGGEFDRTDSGEHFDITWSAGSGWMSVYFVDGTIWNFKWSFAPNGTLRLYNMATGYTTVYWRD